MSAAFSTSRPSAAVVGILALGLALCSVRVAAQTARAGAPIVEFVESLRDSGARIVYSEDVLPARLRIAAVPEAADPLTQLRQVLAPVGLDVELGPRDTWLIVEAAPAARQRDAALPTAPEPAGPAPSLETVVVTASRYAFERPSAISASSINRLTLETTPVLGQDPLRVTHGLPGVTSNELSSQAHIRGGALDEVLLKLDGVRLYSPYHLKNFQNIFSSINPRIVEAIDVRTGGYEARYGDRMSGVIDMKSIAPAEARHHELALSTLETSVLSSGLFANGRGSWVTSLRRGNLDLLIDAANSDVGDPQYVDFFNKLRYSFSPHWTFTTGVLSLDDKISLRDADKAESGADYDDAYYWIAFDQDSASGLRATYRFSATSIKRSRNGRIDDPNKVTGNLTQRSVFDRAAFSADFDYELSRLLHLYWGLEYADTRLDYRFTSEREMLRPIVIDDLSGPSAPPASAAIATDNTQRSAYASVRIQALPRLTAELGARWDDQSLPADHQVSPRLSLLFDLSARLHVRAAWGRYYQSESLDEVAVADGQLDVLPAEKSDHAVLGIERDIGDNVQLRLEAYSKDIDRLNTRFENVFERVSLLPELLPDRYAIVPRDASIRGIELSAEGRSGAFRWWSNLSRSETSESLASGSFERSWDETWAVKGGGDWSGNRWTASISATYRSGWPITDLALVNDVLVAGRYNDVRLPEFASVDVRASRSFDTGRGQLDWFVEVSNLFNHANHCCVDYEIDETSMPATLRVRYGELLGLIPSTGIRWQF